MLTIIANSAPNGERNSLYPDGPTFITGNDALGMFTWGAVAEGEPLHIYTDGTNDFGAGPTIANIVYDDFSGYTDGEQIGTTATIGTWNSVDTGVVAEPDPHSGTHCARVVNDTFWGAVKKTYSAVTEAFTSYALKVPEGSEWPSASSPEDFGINGQFKSCWFYRNNALVDQDCDLTGFSFVSNNFLAGSNNLDYSKVWGAAASLWQWGGWNYFTHWYKAGADPGVDNGILWTQIVKEGTGQTITVFTDVPVFQGGTAPLQWTKYSNPGFAGNLASGNKMLADSICLNTGANANARVVIGDNQTFASCTKVCTMPPSSWSSELIIADLRQFSLPSLIGAKISYVLPDNSVNYIGQLA